MGGTPCTDLVKHSFRQGYSNLYRGRLRLAGSSLKLGVYIPKCDTFNKNLLVIMENTHEILHLIATINQLPVQTIPIESCRVGTDVLPTRIPYNPLSLSNEELHPPIVALQEMCRLRIRRQLAGRNQKSICKVICWSSWIMRSQHRCSCPRMYSISCDNQIACESRPIRKCD
jgi:hypothetical protein